MPGHIIFNTQLCVFKSTDNTKQNAQHTVRFVLCTIKDFNGFMNGYIFDEHYEQLVKQTLHFKTVDEFFQFIQFVTKHGL